jgi:CheY-like chemotaxis protein
MNGDGGAGEKTDLCAECSRRVQEAILQRHLRSLETLSAGVAHEFNNLHAGVIGYAQMALESLHDDDFVRRALTTCLRAARRGTEITNRLNHFARRERPDWILGDLRSTVRDVLELSEHRLRHDGVTLVADLGPLPWIRFDPALLAAALQELLQNAEEAVRTRPQPPRLIRVTAEAIDGEAVIAVGDNGAGMTEEHLDQAGTPFFTTKGAAAAGPLPDAEGLGLAMVRGITASLGGTFEIRSTPEEGTIARMILPAAPEDGQREPERILVVDDESTSRRILTVLLEKAGYEVVAVESARQALDALLSDGFQLVFLDQVMPEITGTDFLQQLSVLRAERPIPPIVVITAEYSPELARQALRLGAAACTSKPVNRDKVTYIAGTYTGRIRNEEDEAAHAESVLPGLQERILVVDPDPLVRDAVGMLLERSGFRPELTASGADALHATEEEYYDLILVDPHLHDRAGEEVIREIRLNNPYTPILVSYASGDYLTVRDALKAGATQAIRKPVDVQALLREVSRLMQLFREERPQLS